MNRSLHIPAHNRSVPYAAEKAVTTKQLLSAPEVAASRTARLNRLIGSDLVAELDAVLSAHDFSAEVHHE